ncbi:hypothetical protein ElyMa_002198200 [Elysia marginata]|uniref:Uncharacterized protein n=1 Tax=Elysia marginata TaxID=1093978 RepID=A0AAV4FSZ3_9GAST|nr:hypothetical protein ElyMa_002198200 [Elysia marginata]
MAGKRGAESVFSTLAPQRIYLNVESVEGESVSDLSPFRLHRKLLQILGRECKMSKTNRGVMLEADEEKLMGMKELGGLKAKVTKYSYLNTSRGVINQRFERKQGRVRGMDSWRYKRQEDRDKKGGGEDQDEDIRLDLRLPNHTLLG